MPEYVEYEHTPHTESEFIQQIVEEISNSKLYRNPLHVATYPVGVNSRMETLEKLLDIESNDVRMIGISGIGGIGKTTIAKAIYNSISYEFKAKSFLENVRERSKTHIGIIHLQEELLSNISQNKILKIETLLRQCDCFASGSRIIMTTRYKSLLVKRNGLSTYDYGVKELNEYEATKLFRNHAFLDNKLYEDYLELEKKAIHYAKGLPLALKVMGADLCGKTINEWKDALDY
ncbi:TMV resistance protein N-like [Quercus lobata]|uniref:TMV resistance protein N-like n=1 Tax=Quercus lobata TaxID=97700 RepID=UPI001247F194|nr:TMV resistance protein N-like [Quercus lobata]